MGEGIMKNLYICSFVAVALTLSACGQGTHTKPSNPNGGSPSGKTNVADQAGTIKADIPLAKAALAFKDKGFDPNLPENKALAEDIGGAQMQVVGGEKVGPAEVQVILDSSCEIFSATMWDKQRKPAKVKFSKLQPGGTPDMYGTIETRCIGIHGVGCDQVGVLFTRNDLNGHKAQTVITFSADENGKYSVTGWPTSKHNKFVDVESFRKVGQCNQKTASLVK